MLINLKVKTLDAQTHEFNGIDNEITVRDLKDQIAEKTGISPDQQRIIYCGRVLADEKYLKEYDVDGKVLHVAERPPPLQRSGSASSSTTSTDNGGGSRDRPHHHNMRNSPLFRALDGMVVGTMAIPMNGGSMHNGPTALHPLTASSSFCMNRITVARHMLNCANNIAAYLEDPSRGLNNVPLDILARGRWTMESTVVEVGITATDLPQSQNIVEMVQGAVSAALRRHGNTNVTVVQLPTMFSSNDGDSLAAGGDINAVAGGLDISDGNASTGDRGIDSIADHHAAVIIEDIIQDMDDATTNASSNVAQAGSAASSDSGSSNGGGRSNSTNTTDGGIGSTSVGTNTDDNIQSRRTGTNVLAEVFEQMRTVWARLAPFIEQSQEMLQNEPTFDEQQQQQQQQQSNDSRENAQRLFDRVSEAFHYLSHAQHAISDLMLDYGQPTPRYLTCRPILVEQSGYVSSNNYMSAAAAAAAAANAFRQTQNNTQQQPTSLFTNMTQGATAAATTTTTPQTAPLSTTTTTAAATTTTTQSETDTARDTTPLTGANSNSNSNSSANNIEDDAIDDLISGTTPRTGQSTNNPSTTTSNAGTQSNDNHQLQMARLIQAVVNSAPLDTEFHVQINAPSFVSFGLPMGAVAAVHGIPNRNNRGTTTTPLGSAVTNSISAESSTTLEDTQPTAATAATTTTSASPAAAASAAATTTTNTTTSPSQTVTTESTTTAASTVNSSSSSSTGGGIGTMGNQVRVNTATLPTTSTQTRSTSRPQVQIGNLPTNNIGTGNGGRLIAPQMSAFDRFLPCNSHHIRETNESISNENGMGSNPANPTTTRTGFSGSFLNQGNAANRATTRILTDLIRRPALTVGTTISSPRASAAPYTRRPTNTQSSSNGSPSANANANANAAGSAIASVQTIGTGTERGTERGTATDDRNGPSITAISNFWEDPCNNILRNQFIEFFNETLFDGLPMNDANKERALNRAIDWFAEHLFYLRQYENQEYDCRDSVLNILRKMWPLFIEAFMDRHIGAEQYEVRVKLMCKQFVTRLYSVLIVCIGRENADLFWSQLMRHLAAPVKLRFRSEACQFLLCFITSEIPATTDIDDAGQFIIHRRDDEEDVQGDVQEEANKNATKEPESMEESDHLQSVNSASSELTQMDTEMLDIASTSSLSNQSDLTATTNSLDSAFSSTMELPKVDEGTESWHNAFQSSWLPLLTRDVQYQAQHPPSQLPFSDGYISAKRRKTNQSCKAPTDFKNLIASSVRETLQSVLPANAKSSSSGSNPTSTTAAATATANATAAAAVAANNLMDSDVINTTVKAISEDAAVQIACKDSARTNIRQRLKNDEDYEPDRFPLTTKFVEKN